MAGLFRPEFDLGCGKKIVLAGTSGAVAVLALNQVTEHIGFGYARLCSVLGG